MASRRIASAVAGAAGIVLSGWIASSFSSGPAGAWAALTLFPGWFAYTVLSQHPFSEPLDLTGSVAVSLGAWIFWTLVIGGAALLMSRANQLRRRL